VQHTPSPERTIAALYEQVRPGGWLVIDHYPRDRDWYTRTAPLFRAVLKRLDPERGLAWTERLVRVFLPLHKAVRHSRVGRAVVNRLSPVAQYYHDVPELDDRLQREWALLDTHDTLTDWFKHFRSTDEIAKTLRDLGGLDVWAGRGGNGVEARARRPAASGDSTGAANRGGGSEARRAAGNGRVARPA
jgi:hypothetical protein